MQKSTLNMPEWMVTLGNANIDIRKVVFVGGFFKENSNFNKYKVVFASGFELTVTDNGGYDEIALKRDEFLRLWAKHCL